MDRGWVRSVSGRKTPTRIKSRKIKKGTHLTGWSGHKWFGWRANRTDLQGLVAGGEANGIAGEASTDHNRRKKKRKRKREKNLNNKILVEEQGEA